MATEAAMLAAVQKHTNAIKRLLELGQVGDAAKLEGMSLAQVLAQAAVNANAYTDQEVLDLVEGNALIEAVDNAIAEIGAPMGGEFATAITEKAIDMGAGNDIVVSSGNHFTKTVAANTTFSVSQAAAAGRVSSFTLHITNGGAFTINWWSGIVWAEGKAPTLTAAGRDVLAFTTLDGGTTWDGYLLGKDMKAAA